MQQFIAPSLVLALVGAVVAQAGTLDPSQENYVAQYQKQPNPPKPEEMLVNTEAEPELAKGFTEMITIFKAVLDQAVVHGSLPADFDTASEAAFIMDLWAGAQQRTLIFRDVEPLRRALEVFRKRLTKTT